MRSGCIIIGDIRKSREIKDWAPLIRKLELVLREVNREFKDEILVPFVPTVGDEFQGGLKSPRYAYDICLKIKRGLSVDHYCGIGIGEIERPLGEVGMRGTAFYRARNALETCKKLKRWIFLSLGDGESPREKVLNILFRVVEEFQSLWTKRQKEIIDFIRSQGDLTYEKIGDHFGISKQTVSKILKSARWDTVQEVEVVIRDLLRQPFEGDNTV